MKLIEGHKYIHTDILGKKWELTYTGTRREIKGCEFEFFIGIVDPTVKTIQKVIIIE